MSNKLPTDWPALIEKDARRIIRQVGKPRALDLVDVDYQKAASTGYMFTGHAIGAKAFDRAEYLRLLFNKINEL